MIRRTILKKLIIPLIILTVLSSIVTLAILIMQIVWNYIGFTESSSQISMNLLSCTTYQQAKYIYSKQLFGITFIAILINYLCEIMLFIFFVLMTIIIFLNSRNSSEQINPDETQETLFKFPRVILFYFSYFVASLNVLSCIVHFGYYLSFYTQITDSCSASDFKTHYIVFFSLMALVLILAIIIWIILLIIAILSKPDQLEEKNQQRRQLLLQRRKQENQSVKNKQIQLTRNNLLTSPGRNENLETHNSLAQKSKQGSPRKALVDDRYIVLKQQEEKKPIEQDILIRKRKEESNYYERNFERSAEKSKINNTPYENRRNAYDKPNQEHHYHNNRQSQQNQQLRHLRPKRTAVPPLAFQENKNKVNPTPKFNHQMENQMRNLSPKKRQKYQQNYYDQNPHFHHHHDRQQKAILPNEGGLKQQGNPFKQIHSSYAKGDQFKKSKGGDSHSNKKDRRGMMIDYIRGKYAD